jgi:hypothetical protein
MPKQYSYQFGYYWKIVWPDNGTFKSDSQNYRGFKQRVKREFKIVNEDNVVLYLNLRWTTTLGKIHSLFPSSTSIEVSSADEFKEVKDARDVKQSPSKKISKLKKTLEPTDEFSLRMDPVQDTGRFRLVKNDRKRTYKVAMMESEEIQKVKPTLNLEDGAKKLHAEEDSRSTQSTEDENRSPKVLDIVSPMGQCEVNSISDIEISNTDKKIRNQIVFPIYHSGAIENESDFRWENGLLPDLTLEDIHVPTKIRNFGIENSINPIYWENEFQDNFTFGML